MREAGQPTASAPTSSDKAQRQISAGDEQVFGWRPAIGQPVARTKWVLEQKLGEGGFGEVWLGRHQTMKERRVFKFCFQPERVRFLKRELTLFRLLKERAGDHPNIVGLREVSFDEPPFYVEMEYVEGKDLRSWCEEHGGAAEIPIETRLEVVAQLAEALQAAHDAGIIHRDIKPTNILITAKTTAAVDLKVKLTDFGIGQVVSQEYLAGITRAGFTQTLIAESSSSQTGTQLYMAPELVTGKPASTRSDIYSLGVVLYQLLLGDFACPLTIEWTEQISDPLLVADLKKCLAGNPQERFEGAGQLARNLRSLPVRRRALAEQQAALALRERMAYRRGVVRAATLSALLLAIFGLLSIYAFRQARRAHALAQQESRQRELLRLSLYAANMNLALQAVNEGNLGRASTVLAQYRPQPRERDLRGFEWRYLWKQAQSDEAATLGNYDGPYAWQALAFSPNGMYLANRDGPNIAIRLFRTRTVRGWAFRDGPGLGRDLVNGFEFLREAYLATDPDYSARVTVPVLWDKETKAIVNNSEDDICRMLQG